MLGIVVIGIVVSIKVVLILGIVVIGIVVSIKVVLMMGIVVIWEIFGIVVFIMVVSILAKVDSIFGKVVSIWIASSSSSSSSISPDGIIQFVSDNIKILIPKSLLQFALMKIEYSLYLDIYVIENEVYCSQFKNCFPT